MNITIQQSDQVIERNVPASIIHYIYNLGEDPNIDLSGAIQLTGGAYVDEIEAVQLWYQNLYITADKQYIRFEDPVVEPIILQRVSGGDGIGIDVGDVQRFFSLGQAFRNNTQLTTFKEFIYFTGCRSLDSYCFYGCSNLTSLGIPRSVTSSSAYAFIRCNKLKHVYITDLEAWCNITYPMNQGTSTPFTSSQAGNLYLNGTKITNLVIPDSITTIKTYAFYGITGFTSVTFNSNITTVGYRAFEKCTGIQNIYITDLEAWCNIAWQDTYGNPLQYAGHLYLNDVEITGDLVIPEGITKIKNYAFLNRTNITSVTIPTGLTDIESGAFFGCTGINKIYIPDLEQWLNITNINSLTGNAIQFYVNNQELTNIVVPNSITRIPYYAFRNFCNITSATIPNTVTEIGSYAFGDCTSLTTIDIPSGVTTIGTGAFTGCTNLQNITVRAITPPSMSAISIPSQVLHIYVPAESVDTYKAASGWSNFASKIQAIPSNP